MKTLEEFVIKEIQDLRKENQDLEECVKEGEAVISNLRTKQQHWENKYKELVENLKKDFGITLLPSVSGTYYISTNWVWDNDNKERFEYYKNLFNLKEEKQEEKKDE